jgi:protein gp37
VESDEYKRRIDHLYTIPAAVRFVSIEPMLGPLEEFFEYFQWQQLDWVICGGESGPGARPMHPEWVRSIRDLCEAADVPFFFKQWGEWLPQGQYYECKKFQLYDSKYRHDFKDGTISWKVGKKNAGRFLDNREWNQYPEFNR